VHVILRLLERDAGDETRSNGAEEGTRHCNRQLESLFDLGHPPFLRLRGDKLSCPETSSWLGRLREGDKEGTHVEQPI
jgi:hypothetical protein